MPLNHDISLYCLNRSRYLVSIEAWNSAIYVFVWFGTSQKFSDVVHHVNDIFTARCSINTGLNFG